MDIVSFHNYKISEDIVKALNGLEYDKPTEVQAKVIPSALEKDDLMVKAQTGSGKTAAYAIPICELIEWLENKPQALILTPTRELAVQVKEDFTNIGRFKRLKAAAIYGGHPFSMEKAELKQKTHVVVGTPGRVMDHIKKGTLPLSKISCLVIDEADRMLDMGFIEQVEAIMKELPEDRMTMLFSATISDEVKNLASNYMRDPVNIDVSEESIMTSDINHFLYVADEEDKFELLTDVMIIEKPDSCIIFCSTKDRVDMVCDLLDDLGYPCNKIHGGMEQADRLSAMMRFKRGEYRYLIATDVAARGIDIENISLVINYDIPLDEENYVHRTGRTGRAGQKGKAISFVTPTQTR
ncbi:MAG: DEAD/DEAH box helicase, partial [Lacrimispora sp.]